MMNGSNILPSCRGLYGAGGLVLCACARHAYAPDCACVGAKIRRKLQVSPEGSFLISILCLVAEAVSWQIEGQRLGTAIFTLNYLCIFHTYTYLNTHKIDFSYKKYICDVFVGCYMKYLDPLLVLLNLSQIRNKIRH